MFYRAVAFLVALAALLAVRAAENLPLPEYQMKAAFLYNFAKFVEWPVQAFERGNSPIILGILGEDPFGNDLESTIAGKAINGRPVQVKRFRSDRQVEFCHVLFISRSERRRLPEIFENLKGKPTLTIGDQIERFCVQGGMIGFVMENKKVRFEINNAAAESVGLHMSSKLQRLAIRPQAP